MLARIGPRWNARWSRAGSSDGTHALGAIVAPPDAAAATTILCDVQLPYRILKILEGESLLNDASALLIYRVAVGAAVAEHSKWSAFAPEIALAGPATRRKRLKSSGTNIKRCCCAPKPIRTAAWHQANCRPTRCAGAPSPPRGARCWRCADPRRSATTPSTGSRRNSTGPS